MSLDPVELGRLLQTIEHQQESIGKLTISLENLINKQLQPMAEQVTRNSFALKIMGTISVILFPAILSWNYSLLAEIKVLNKATTILEAKADAATNSSKG